MSSYQKNQKDCKRSYNQTEEVKAYIKEKRRFLDKFGIILSSARYNKFVRLRTIEQVDEFVEREKKKYMSKYIKEKIKILKELGITLTDKNIKYMKLLASPIYVDNYAHDLILRRKN